MKIELNKEQLNNLMVFLGRTQLNGAEVNSFNEIVGILVASQREEMKQNQGQGQEKKEEKKDEEKPVLGNQHK